MLTPLTRPLFVPRSYAHGLLKYSTSTNNYTGLRAATYLLLFKGNDTLYSPSHSSNHVLLLKRKNTGWMDGYYTLPSGHVEHDEENITEAMAREAKEEIGIKVKPENLEVVLTMYRQSGERRYIDFFLIIKGGRWEGEPFNAEPHKCSELKFCDILNMNNLPPNTLPNVRKAIKYWKEGKHFIECGPFETNV